MNAFASTARLNPYKTARLGNRFKWALKDAGYPDEFAGTLTQELAVTQSSRKGAAPS